MEFLASKGLQMLVRVDWGSYIHGSCNQMTLSKQGVLVLRPYETSHTSFKWGEEVLELPRIYVSRSASPL
jgi:hypothetical protein